MAIDKLNHYSMQNPASVYDEEALTALELAARTAAKVNECAEQVNENTEALPRMVDDTVQNHINNGTFDVQIDEHQQGIRAEVEENRVAMQNQLGNKLDKGAAGAVNMGMLAQDVKEAMTGGSVAVVGANAVATDNIMDAAITPAKLKPIVSSLHCFPLNYDATTPVIKLTRVGNIAEFGRTDTIRMFTAGRYFDIDLSTATLDSSKWTTATVRIWYEEAANTFHVTNALNFYYDWFLIGFYYDNDAVGAVLPFSFNGGIYTPHGRNVRSLSQLAIRPFNTDYTKVVPYIDFDARELVIPQYLILYGVVGDSFDQLVNTEASIVRIPFVDGSHQYLVGNVDEFKFISAAEYVDKMSTNKYKHVFGYADPVGRQTSFTFECPTKRSLSILGDSISTYKGYIPEGNATYYSGTGNVNHPYYTWWFRLMNRCGLELNVNNSWSGGKVTGGEGSSATARANLLDNGTDPDVIILFMGINDFNTGVAVGSYDGRSVPSNTSTFREAYALTLKTILTRYKSAKVYAMTLPACQRSLDDDNNAPEINRAGVGLWEYNRAIRDIAEMFHVEVIDTATCQINNYNGTVNMVDYVSETGGFLHPNKAGFKKIADKVIKSVLHSAE